MSPHKGLLHGIKQVCQRKRHSKCGMRPCFQVHWSGVGNAESQRWRGVESRDGFTQCRGFVHIKG